ncbi:MAG: hypothetical protein SVQ76_02765 [Candidatus Nanohaloarchaea archaeon]|nr:hypothetical protein [Candidatus Nanohaloarchaea archaeon]
MQQVYDRLAVHSPFLNVRDPRQYGLEELSRDVAADIERVRDGDDLEVLDESVRRYSFSDAVQSSEPDWLRPELACIVVGRNDPSVVSWAREVQRELESEDHEVLLDDDFGVDRDRRLERADEYPLTLEIGDSEDRYNTVRVLDEEGDTRSVEDVEEKMLSIDREDFVPDTGSSFTYNREDGIEVRPDLSTGFFKAEREYERFTQDAMVFVPYADAEEAVAVRTPNAQDPSVSEEVVNVGEKWPSGNEFVSAVAESLSYFVPFWGIPQPRVSSEAVRYDTDNGVCNQPYSIRIGEEAWSSMRGRTEEPKLWKDVGDKAYRLASHPDTSPLDRQNRPSVQGNISQLNDDGEYLLWEREGTEDTGTVVVKDILDYEQAYPGSSRR